MTAKLDDVLSAAALNETERRVIERLLERLRAELRDELLAVWLYGSRARGEADPDRRSDVDLLAIIGAGSDAGEVAWEAQPQLEAIADAEGDSPVYYSLRFYDAEFLRRRRAIRDFFFQEVDRDKLILHGDALAGYGGGTRGACMGPRSEEFVDQTRDRLAMAREVLAAGHREGAVSAAYYSMLYAACATLSEDDENARTHRGMWNLFRIKYVTIDAFDAALFTLAQHAQVAREGGDYSAVTPSEEEARRYVEGAGDFLAAVEAMLGAVEDGDPS